MDDLPARREETPSILASDSERDATVDALREHCAQGRLTLEEFAERLDVALRARTRGELDRVTHDLPVEPLEPVLPRRVPAPAGPARRRFVAILGRSARGRRWRVPERADALAILGECELDLREAIFVGDELELQAVAVLGQVRILVPEGMRVEVQGFALLGENQCDADETGALPGMPVLRVRAYSLLGEVEIKARPARPRLGPPRI